MKTFKILFTLIIGIVFVLSACDNVDETIDKIEKYNVDFYYEKDDVYISFIIEEGKKSTEPINPYSENQVFEYWTLNSIEFSFDTIIEEDIELYAKWGTVNEEEPVNDIVVTEDGLYTSKDEVALYIVTFQQLPSNYVTKSEVDGDISDIWTETNKASIGGDVFGNREELLPKDEGLTYTELDIDYNGVSRGAKRIVYSSDFRVFYTDDHYDSFVEYDKETRGWN